jgi:hypothetical protein
MKARIARVMVATVGRMGLVRSQVLRPRWATWSGLLATDQEGKTVVHCDTVVH